MCGDKEYKNHENQSFETRSAIRAELSESASAVWSVSRVVNRVFRREYEMRRIINCDVVFSE